MGGRELKSSSSTGGELPLRVGEEGGGLDVEGGELDVMVPGDKKTE